MTSGCERTLIEVVGVATPWPSHWAMHVVGRESCILVLHATLAIMSLQSINSSAILRFSGACCLCCAGAIPMHRSKMLC